MKSVGRDSLVLRPGLCYSHTRTAPRTATAMDLGLIKCWSLIILMAWYIGGRHSSEREIKRTHKSRTAKLLFVNRLHAAKQFIAPLTGLVLRLSRGVKTRFHIAKKFHSLHISSFLKPGFASKKAVVYIYQK